MENIINMTIEQIQEDIKDTIIEIIIEHDWSLSSCITLGYYEDIKNNLLENAYDLYFPIFNYYSEELRGIVFNYLKTDLDRLALMLDETEFIKVLIEIYYEDCYDEALTFLAQEGYFNKGLD